MSALPRDPFIRPSSPSSQLIDLISSVLGPTPSGPEDKLIGEIGRALGTSISDLPSVSSAARAPDAAARAPVVAARAPVVAARAPDAAARAPDAAACAPVAAACAPVAAARAPVAAARAPVVAAASRVPSEPPFNVDAAIEAIWGSFPPVGLDAPARTSDVHAEVEVRVTRASKRRKTEGGQGSKPQASGTSEEQFAQIGQVSKELADVQLQIAKLEAQLVTLKDNKETLQATLNAL